VRPSVMRQIGRLCKATKHLEGAATMRMGRENAFDQPSMVGNLAPYNAQTTYTYNRDRASQRKLADVAVSTSIDPREMPSGRKVRLRSDKFDLFGHFQYQLW
jgi:hypothetical protein